MTTDDLAALREALADEMSNEWTSVERAIWPDGPASGHGSGAYAGLKASVIRVISTARADEGLREALREAYTLLVSAEPTLIRDARSAPNETSAHYKALLRGRVKEWLDPIREDFDGWIAALSRPAPAPEDVERLADELADVADQHRPSGETADAIGLIREWLARLSAEEPQP
jgi:hypothetical protein